MSRWRRLRISLLVGAIPAVAITVGGLWGTAEEGGVDADSCGSIIHRTSDSAFCRGALTATYASKLAAAVVAGLAVTLVVFGLLALVVWIRRGRRPGSARRRLALTGAVTVVLVLATTSTAVVAHQVGPNPCQPARRPIAVAQGDRVEAPFGDAGATGTATLTPPRGTLAPAWCASVEDLTLSPSDGLPLVSGGLLFGSGHDDDRLRAVDLADGRTRWTSSAYGTPAVLAGSTLVVEEYDRLAGVDARTGTRRWTTAPIPTRYAAFQSVTVAGGRVYASADDAGADQSWLMVFDLRTGRRLASRALGSRLVQFMSVPVADGGVTVALEGPTPAGSGSPGTSVVKIAAVGSSSRLVHLDAATLAPEWQATIPGEVRGLLATGGTVVASATAGADGSFWTVWGAVDGRASWTHAVATPCGLESVLADGPQLITTVGGPSSCGGTSGWDLATGIPRWRASDVGTAWLSGDRVVGVAWLGRRGGATVATIDDDGQGHHVWATMPTFALGPVVVGGLVLSPSGGPGDGLEAYGPP